MAEPTLQWRVYNDADEVAEAACMHILQASEKAIEQRGSFHLVLAGGTTPANTYRLLAKTTQPWQYWHLWFGDERCLPIEDPERNSYMVKQTLTTHVPIPDEQIHIIPAEEDAEIAANKYAEEVSNHLPFDIVLLGMGEDGHTASLFPGHTCDKDSLVIPVHHAPKPPPDRVSLNLPAINQCREMLIMVTGKGKREAVQLWREGQDLPISRVHGKNVTEVLIDHDALGKE